MISCCESNIFLENLMCLCWFWNSFCTCYLSRTGSICKMEFNWLHCQNNKQCNFLSSRQLCKSERNTSMVFIVYITEELKIKTGSQYRHMSGSHSQPAPNYWLQLLFLCCRLTSLHRDTLVLASYSFDLPDHVQFRYSVAKILSILLLDPALAQKEYVWFSAAWSLHWGGSV